MATAITKQTQRASRRARIRARVKGTAARPRLAVFKSNRFIYAQLIDDDAAKTIASADSRTTKGDSARERAVGVGREIAEKAKQAGVTAVVFDRGGYRYQGMVAALADAAREAGLTF